MTFRDCLPINRIELWILRIAQAIGFIAIGALLMAVWMIQRNDFKMGQDYLHACLTDPRMNERR